ncbi:MAG: hypothetical protein GY769_24605 [bacterium]|nr:hypothetical protein [bacterium]
MPDRTSIASESEQVADDIGSLLASTEECWNGRRFLFRDLPRDLLWCLVIGLILTLILTPFIGGGPGVWIQSFVFNSIISLCIGLAVSNAFRFGLPALRRLFPGAASGIVLYAFVAVTGTALGAEAAVRVIDALGGIKAASFRADVLRIAFVVVAIILTAELAYTRLRQKARRDELRAQQARKQALHAELKALQARTNPHFLFNSLNTVAGLIEENPAGAERVLEKLAGLFRYTLKGTEVGWVRLAEELDNVSSYLEVETIRLGDRLQCEFQVPPQARDVLVPPLVLQPLVENAVLHAVAPRKRGGSVRVGAVIRDSNLVLSVSDDGDGPGTSPHRGSGTSLSELEERLDLVYGGTSDFWTGANPEGGFEVRLTLPMQGKP